MKKPHTFKLIDGKFSPVEARKILIELIQNKINFHSRQIHMMEEHNEGNTAHSKSRIARLKKTSENLKKILIKADNSGTRLKVKGTIEIEFLD
jgi:hypothetical protein